MSDKIKSICRVVFLSILIGLFSVALYSGRTYAKKFETPPKGGLPVCMENLNTCGSDLNTCNTDLAACEAQPSQACPGDGYSTIINGGTDTYGTPGHGPVLSYTDNGDGTFTDDNSLLMWEEKDNLGGIHDVGNTYTWSSTDTAADGTLFAPDGFLDTLNNKCEDDETTSCVSNDDCDNISPCIGGTCTGNCGFAGYRDWRIPNIKELQGIVDYSVFNPAWSAPGPVGTAVDTFYWASTTNASNTSVAWTVDFVNGILNRYDKSIRNFFARAVRTP